MYELMDDELTDDELTFSDDELTFSDDELTFSDEDEDEDEEEILFEDIYDYIIPFIIAYNENEKLIDQNKIYAHIKGGSSIKYHLNKMNVDTENITNDIDIMLLNYETDVTTSFKHFYNILTEYIPDITWNIIFENGIYIIKIGDVNIIDVSFYSEMNHFNDETSMFNYALTELNLTIYDYYTQIISSDDIETITFTSPEFEFNCTIKAIDVYTNYINEIESKKTKMEKLINQKEQLGIEDESIYHYELLINQLNYELRPEHIDKLINKLNRYEMKLELIREYLTI